MILYCILHQDRHPSSIIFLYPLFLPGIRRRKLHFRLYQFHPRIYYHYSVGILFLLLHHHRYPLNPEGLRALPISLFQEGLPAFSLMRFLIFLCLSDQNQRKHGEPCSHIYPQIPSLSLMVDLLNQGIHTGQ